MLMSYCFLGACLGEIAVWQDVSELFHKNTIRIFVTIPVLNVVCYKKMAG